MYGVSADIANQAEADQAWREWMDSAESAWWTDDSVDKERRVAFVMRYLEWRCPLVLD